MFRDVSRLKVNIQVPNGRSWPIARRNESLTPVHVAGKYLMRAVVPSNLTSVRITFSGDTIVTNSRTFNLANVQR